MNCDHVHWILFTIYMDLLGLSNLSTKFYAKMHLDSVHYMHWILHFDHICWILCTMQLDFVH